MIHHVGLAAKAQLRHKTWLGLPWTLNRRLAKQALVIMAFVSLILASNYALAAFPSVKLFDLAVFVAGYTLGFRRGATVAALSWLIYGTFNPYGPSNPPLMVTVMASEGVYALAGALLRKAASVEGLSVMPGRRSLLLGLVAVVCTIAYDLAANLLTGVEWAQMAQSSAYGRWALIALFNPGALLFMAMHVGSNFAFFTLLGPGLIKATDKILRKLGVD